ncbi:hypothetical protein HT031_001714 [Scenedesmus sp. PABB004]|nr:hypothetical protein HT031_001714 [Scenedesmus sp. PABB004]
MLDYLKGAAYNYLYGTACQKLLITRGVPPLAELGAPDASGLTVVVTGPTSGIGWATAAELARRGAHGGGGGGGARPTRPAQRPRATPRADRRRARRAVVLACRSAAKGESMVAALTADAAAAGRRAPSLEVSLLDLASLDSVRDFVERWEAGGRALHVLINNAGLFNMGVGRCETGDGVEVHMQTNHLAHFLLTLGLLPALRRAAAAGGGGADRGAARGFVPRVVSVASAMHHLGYRLRADPEMRGAYSAELAYGNSKLAQVAFTRELAARLSAAGAGVDALAVHPGNVLTDVVRSLPARLQAAYRLLMTRVLLTPDEGARASVYAATDPGAAAAAAATGGYLDCSARPVAPHRLAADPDLGAWLWRWSAERVGLREAWDLAPAPAQPAGT